MKHLRVTIFNTDNFIKSTIKPTHMQVPQPNFKQERLNTAALER